MDEFFGFDAEETKHLTEIRELKEILKENQDLIDEKDKIISSLRMENYNLKEQITALQQQYQFHSRHISDSSSTTESAGDLPVNNGQFLANNIIENSTSSLNSLVKLDVTTLRSSKSAAIQGSALFLLN